MYQEKFKAFENIENLAGKAWEHAVVLDHFSNMKIKGRKGVSTLFIVGVPIVTPTYRARLLSCFGGWKQENEVISIFL